MMMTMDSHLNAITHIGFMVCIIAFLDAVDLHIAALAENHLNNIEPTIASYCLYDSNNI